MIKLEVLKEVKAIPGAAAAIDAMLPQGTREKSLVTFSDRDSKAVYGMYRVSESPPRIAVKRQGGGEDMIEIHFAGEKIGGKVNGEFLSADAAKTKLEEWLRGALALRNIEIDMERSAFGKMSTEDRLKYKIERAMNPIDSLPDAYQTLDTILTENGDRHLSRPADEYVNPRTARYYQFHRISSGGIRLALEWTSYHDDMGQDSIEVYKPNQLRHVPIPGKTLTEPAEMLDKLNELLKGFITSKVISRP